jgi:catalase
MMVAFLSMVGGGGVDRLQPRADHEIPDAETAWDFYSSNPSTMHTLMWVLSGHGIPRSYRHVDGFGVHTFRFVTADGKSKLVKYHFKTKQGLASLVWAESLALNGQNAEFHRQDLFDAIESGNYPEWEVGVQIMEESDALRFGFDLNDPTKIVPVEVVPITPIGKLVLNRNPKNYFAETEQVMVRCPLRHRLPGFVRYAYHPCL